jgi:hypothetical protein
MIHFQVSQDLDESLFYKREREREREKKQRENKVFYCFFLKK